MYCTIILFRCYYFTLQILMLELHINCVNRNIMPYLNFYFLYYNTSETFITYLTICIVYLLF